MRKWNFNNLNMKRLFGKIDSEQSILQKVFVVNWYTISDDISVELDRTIAYVKSLRPTQRNVMKVMARIYGPLGMLGPFTVTVKILLKKIWQLKSEWDSTLYGELADEFVNQRDD